MKNVFSSIVALVAMLVVGAFHYFPSNRGEFGSNASNCNLSIFTNVGVASSTVVTTGNNMILPTSSVREYVNIRNDGVDAVSLNFGDVAVAGKGYYLAPSSTVEISPCGSLYTKNSIQGTMESGGGSATLQLFFKHVAQ